MAFSQGKRWGFDYVCLPSEGLFPARKNSVWGFIDKEGVLIIPTIYQIVWGFKAGLAPAKKNGLWGFIDRKGRVIIDFQYDFVYPSGRNYFSAKKGEETVIVRPSDWIKPVLIAFPENLQAGNEETIFSAVVEN
ncbi:MAG: WG repeat-containing protein [Patescibacteria group bacterium]